MALVKLLTKLPQNRAVVCLTNSIEQFSSGAVLQKEVHSRSFFPMAEKSYNVVMVEHLQTVRKVHMKI